VVTPNRPEVGRSPYAPDGESRCRGVRLQSHSFRYAPAGGFCLGFLLIHSSERNAKTRFERREEPQGRRRALRYVTGPNNPDAKDRKTAGTRAGPALRLTYVTIAAPVCGRPNLFRHEQFASDSSRCSAGLVSQALRLLPWFFADSLIRTECKNALRTP